MAFIEINGVTADTTDKVLGLFEDILASTSADKVKVAMIDAARSIFTISDIVISDNTFNNPAPVEEKDTEDED